MSCTHLVMILTAKYNIQVKLVSLTLCTCGDIIFCTNIVKTVILSAGNTSLVLKFSSFRKKKRVRVKVVFLNTRFMNLTHLTGMVVRFPINIY